MMQQQWKVGRKQQSNNFAQQQVAINYDDGSASKA